MECVRSGARAFRRVRTAARGVAEATASGTEARGRSERSRKDTLIRASGAEPETGGAELSCSVLDPYHQYTAW